MNIKEKKFIDLKVLVSVQGIENLAKDSKLFKKYGVQVSLSDKTAQNIEVKLVSNLAREISWIFYQLDYIFPNNPELFIELGLRLKSVLRKNSDIEIISRFIFQEVAVL